MQRPEGGRAFSDILWRLKVKVSVGEQLFERFHLVAADETEKTMSGKQV